MYFPSMLCGLWNSVSTIFYESIFLIYISIFDQTGYSVLLLWSVLLGGILGTKGNNCDSCLFFWHGNLQKVVFFLKEKNLLP